MRKLLLLLVILFLTIPVHAAVLPEELLQEQQDILGLDALLDALPDPVADQDLLSPDFAGGVREILRQSLRGSQPAVRSALACGASLLAIVLLCELLKSTADDRAAFAVRLAGVLSVTLLCAARFDALVSLAAAALEELSVLSDVLLPTLTAAAAASGAPLSGSALYVGTVFFVSLLTGLMQKLFLPLCYAFLACACTEIAAGNELLTRLRSFIKNGVAFCLKGILICFSGYLTITNVVSGSADAAAVKAAKLALSAMVPVIGSVMGDASETILVSAGLLRSGVGVLGLLGILSICLTPFLRVGVHYLALKLFAALGGALGGNDCVRMMDAAASCMGLLLAQIGVSALLNLISCVCFMKAVIPT